MHYDRICNDLELKRKNENKDTHAYIMTLF